MTLLKKLLIDEGNFIGITEDNQKVPLLPEPFLKIMTFRGKIYTQEIKDEILMTVRSRDTYLYVDDLPNDRIGSNTAMLSADGNCIVVPCAEYGVDYNRKA